MSRSEPPALEPEFEEAVRRVGRRIWEKIQGELPGIFNKEYWVGRVLDWAMEDASFRTDLFRFVDVFPSLRTPGQIAAHVQEYLLREGREIPALTAAGLKLAAGRFTATLGARAARVNVTRMARQFIAGEDEQAALPVLRALHGDGIAATVDLLGEATLSYSEADAYQERYLRLINALEGEVSRWPSDPLIDSGPQGPTPRANVSIKVSALEPNLDAADPSGSVERLKRHLLPLLRSAMEKNVFVNLDMEEWEVHEVTLRVFEEVALDPHLQGWPHLGVVVQSYLKCAMDDAERLLSVAKARGTPISVRLVKGAYWDHEVVRAEQHGYDLPVFTDKALTDANYETLTRFLMQHHATLFPAVASHNLRSLTHAVVSAERMGLQRNGYEVQMLYGMAEPIRKALRSEGCRVRVYTPVGELLPGIGYLVRRLLENTSNTGFLRQTYREGADIADLLRKPVPSAEEKARNEARKGGIRGPFVNCPHMDFTETSVRECLSEAIRECRSRLPLAAPVVVNGRERRSDRVMVRVCPSDTGMKTAVVSLSTREDADAAVEAAAEAWPAWRDRTVDQRAALLERLADRLEADRFALAALECLEVAKPWREADADVAEAIDFCRYYAQSARVEFAPQTLGDVPGERNSFIWEGRGPTAVIAPWNFPIAILCGMTTASLVAGNPVILKPAEQSSATAFAFYHRLQECGFPDGVAHFLPGIGEEVGDYLVRHPGIAQVAFTGSKAVGLSIIENAAKTQPGQPRLKRVVCEMGGKNAVIVDDDADLDQAVAGVMASAFGYAGQKCSACSRVLVVRGVWDRFLKRLVEACRSLLVAPAQEPQCRLGPVVDEEAYHRLMNFIRNPGETAAALYVGGSRQGGHYVPAAVFVEENPESDLMQSELFGPVLAVMKTDTFEDALEIALRTEYALTAGVFSRSPSHLALAEKRLRVGNLYLNRKITGAFVGRQPFGGFGMSGLGTKAGGPGYLLQFAEPRSVAENTTRRGFTPDMET